MNKAVERIRKHPSNSNMYEHQKIANEIAAYQINADKKCDCHKHQYPWSPTLEDIGNKVTYWNSLHMLMKNRKQIPDTMKLHSYGSNIVWSTVTIEEINVTCQEMKSKLKSIQKNATDLREQFLQELAEYYAEIKNKPSAQFLKALRSQEQLTNMYSKLTFNLSGRNKQPINQIVIPLDNGRKVITTAEEIFDAILEENKKIMVDGQGTFPTHSDFVRYAGRYTECEGSDQILQGKLHSTDIAMTESDEVFMKNCTYRNEIRCQRNLQDEYTYEDFCKVFNHTKEQTASSPSGIHVGHYKLGCIYPQLGKLLTQVASIPFQYGYTLRRWCRASHIIIEKKKGNPLLTAMRIIQLLEADYNAVLKIKLGREFI